MNIPQSGSATGGSPLYHYMGVYAHSGDVMGSLGIIEFRDLGI